MVREIEIEYLYLKYSSPDRVYSWLASNAEELCSYRGGLEIEDMLLNRKNALIDLGLALFSINEKTRNYLYSKNERAIQKAVLSNKYCGYFPGVERLLKDKKDSELINVLLTNTEERLFLVDLFKKEGVFAGLEEEFWISLLKMTVHNQILEYPYSEDDPEWGDGIGSLSYATRLYNSVYGLFNLLDANDENAELLSQLLEVMPDIQGNGPYQSESSLKESTERHQELVKKIAPDLLSNIQDKSESDSTLKMLGKWCNPESVSSSEYVYFYENRYGWDTSLDEEYNKVESKCWKAESYIRCRFHLAFSTYKWHSPEIETLKDSNDVALRMVYYRGRNFNLEPNELIDHWADFVGKDGDIFYANIVKNPFILYNETIREFIGEGFVLSKISYVDEYKEKLHEYRESEPNEFKSESEKNLTSRLIEIENNISLLKEDVNSLAIYKRGNEVSFMQILIVVLVSMLLISIWFF